MSTVVSVDFFFHVQLSPEMFRNVSGLAFFVLAGTADLTLNYPSFTESAKHSSKVTGFS